MSNILVTGGTGFTGGHLARRLAGDGHTVRALVRNPEQAGLLTAAGVAPVAGNLCDPESLRRATQGIDTVYHIAALFRPGNATRQELHAVNTQGVQNMLDAAEAAGVSRFVHCSTIGVHGSVKNPPADESAPFSPGDDYQNTKLAGEQIAQKYMREHRLPISIFRPAGIYGPGDTRFLKLIGPVKRGRFVMIGSGQTLFHMVYIDDLVNGIILCGTRPEAVGQVFILAGPEIVTLNRLVQLIAETVGGKPPRLRVPFTPVYWAGFACEMLCKPIGVQPPLFRRRVDFFRKHRAFSIEKAQKMLGYTPQVGLAEGITRTTEWYRAQGLIP